MYDMYPWADVAGREETAVAEADPAPAAWALQVALDRRDNGGVTGAPADR